MKERFSLVSIFVVGVLLLTSGALTFKAYSLTKKNDNNQILINYQNTILFQVQLQQMNDAVLKAQKQYQTAFEEYKKSIPDGYDATIDLEHKTVTLTKKPLVQEHKPLPGKQ